MPKRRRQLPSPDSYDSTLDDNSQASPVGLVPLSGISDSEDEDEDRSVVVAGGGVTMASEIDQ